jgi:hypothetical protein
VLAHRIGYIVEVKLDTPLPATRMLSPLLSTSFEHTRIEVLMGRITPPFRQLYQETLSDLQTELKAALVDLGHKNAFDLLLKEAWNPEVAAMGNSTLPTVLDKLNVMSTIHLRKLIATLVRENGQRDAVIAKLEENIGVLESRLNEIK